MGNDATESGAWVSVGKTIKQLIAELESFENKDLIVELSVDGGGSSVPISLVGKKDGKCILMYTG
ncbi:hypothetical protein RTH74_07040 [Pseudomonas sp. zfem001]|jgi:hypothetical protein|uniref:Uncharacterized protein n=1 Tax=Pseudomonas chaetocerotis TaxID=2758695 RepID=A0A931D1K0_9PSED|nr:MULTISPECIES: hypothetical protein [Pseudomonas]MBZ9667008.1 hypothetical protein [Pseudomonas chaetocerotis]MDU9407348.1 hypothetical protein [Pseudomonas sp. zfem001]